MSNKTIRKFKTMLVAQLGRVEGELDKVGEDAHPNTARETAEAAAFSWQVQVEETRRVLRERLLLSRVQIKDSLKRLRAGLYGICERCGRRIEEARLKIMPTTTLCIGCK